MDDGKTQEEVEIPIDDGLAIEPAEEKKTWLELMEGFILWKVVGPDLTSPYRPFMSDRTIYKLATDREELKKLFTLRCLCDGYEVLKVRNLIAFNIDTNHPCLTHLTKAELKDHLARYEVEQKIEEEVDKAHALLQSELTQRDKEAEASGGKKKKKEHAEPSKDRKSKDANYRVIRK